MPKLGSDLQAGLRQLKAMDKKTSWFEPCSNQHTKTPGKFRNPILYTNRRNCKKITEGFICRQKTVSIDKKPRREAQSWDYNPGCQFIDISITFVHWVFL